MNHYYRTDEYGYPMAMQHEDQRIWGRPWGWGFGRPWGWGGFGGPFFRPWGYGFGFPFFPFFW